MSEFVPILLVTFNRPEHTKQTIDALRIQKPPLVYVFQDGARTGNVRDVENCALVREVIEQGIDWPCELHKVFSETNRGCRDAIIFAISEVLKQHESVIVVEDDIIKNGDNMPGKWQLMIFLGQQTIKKMQEAS